MIRIIRHKLDRQNVGRWADWGGQIRTTKLAQRSRVGLGAGAIKHLEEVKPASRPVFRLQIKMDEVKDDGMATRNVNEVVTFRWIGVIFRMIWRIYLPAQTSESVSASAWKYEWNSNNVSAFSDLVDLWVIKIKKLMILCARSYVEITWAEHETRSENMWKVCSSLQSK